MSSADKGRYQSRLFNFFHKQSQRFNDRFGRSLRQLQVATVWYAEALAKTVYLLLKKAVDSASNQLSATEAQPALQLEAKKPELAADAAIVQILENVEINSKTENFIYGGYSDGKIQGIASQIYSQNLVLVTSENEILDILTPSQQQVLENKIIAEVANYWRCWRLSQSKSDTKLLSRVKSIIQRLSLPKAETTKALPPIKPLQINPSTLASLDIAIAKIETNALTPLSRSGIVVRQRGGELFKVVRHKFDIFLYGDKQNTKTKISAQLNISKQEIVTETQKSKLQNLISAAINYFYGETKTKKINQAPAKPYLSVNKSPTIKLQSQQSSKDDWLTIDDLIGSKYPQLNNSFENFQLPNWRTLQLKEKAGLQTTPDKITPTQTNESTQIEAKPEWIETKAEIVGYQKHPVEQILAWIDSAMLKIEKVFIKLANILGFWRK